MPKQQNEYLYELIKSLSKAEKRNFKLFAARTGANQDAKFIRLFDAIDRQDRWDDADILRKEPEISKTQLANLKAHLYRQILTSLRLLHKNTDVEIGIREAIDNAKVLYNKGLYMQSLKILDKVKKQAIAAEMANLVRDIVEFEKTIESQYVTRAIATRAEELVEESRQVNELNSRAAAFSNITLQLYGVFLKQGYVRTPKGKESLRKSYQEQMPDFREEELTFYEKMLLYQMRHWYYHIIQNFPYAYRYTQKWVDIFFERQQMIQSYPDMFLKGLNNHLTMLFYAGQDTKLEETLMLMSLLDNHTWSDNINMLIFQTRSEHTLNLYFLKGDYEKGVEQIPAIEKGLEEYGNYIDKHHLLIYYYKLGCMFFGNGQYRPAIHYLNMIINEKDTELRGDLHSFARLLLLLSYYEMEDYDYVEHLLKSTYRFLLQKKELYGVLRTVMRFIRRIPSIPQDQLKAEFASYLSELKALSRDPLEARAFLYLDLISWVESKIEGVPVAQVIRRRSEKRRTRQRS